MSEQRRRWMWRLCVGSMVLTLIMIVLSLRSFLITDECVLPFGKGMWRVDLFHGGFYLSNDAPFLSQAVLNPKAPWRFNYDLGRWEDSKLLVFGLVAMHRSCIAVGIPFWAMIGCQVWFIAWWLRNPRRHKRGRSGFCMHCNYDLRGSLDRCPECGFMFAAPLTDGLPAARFYAPGGIVALSAPRVAAGDALDGKPASAPGAVFLDGVDGVLAARGMEAALAAEQAAEGDAVEKDEMDENQLISPRSISR